MVSWWKIQKNRYDTYWILIFVALFSFAAWGDRGYPIPYMW